MTLRNALAQSVNVPAVKALYLASIDESIKTASDMGITTLTDPDRYGLTLVLGGGEVTLLELTSAYGVFANDGVRNPVTGILRIEDRSGNVLENFEEKSERVLDQEIARKITDILSDNNARAPAFGTDSPLQFSGTKVAAKTGTTNDYRDVWVIGYTPGAAIGAWAGNNDNSPMVRRVASFIIAPMWRKIVLHAIEKYPADDFVPPAPETSDQLPPVLRGEWNTNPTEGTHEILYWVKKDDPRGGRPENPSSDSQFALWEYPVQQWAGGMAAQGDAFHITTPAENSLLAAAIPITVQSDHPDPSLVSFVTYYANNATIGSASAPPYAITYTPTEPGSVQIKAVAQLSNGQAQESTVTVTVQ
jgi:membrane peptidoglycan carboxypeptidase